MTFKNQVQRILRAAIACGTQPKYANPLSKFRCNDLLCGWRYLTDTLTAANKGLSNLSQ
jgi:hypothetical protein